MKDVLPLILNLTHGIHEVYSLLVAQVREVLKQWQWQYESNFLKTGILISHLLGKGEDLSLVHTSKLSVHLQILLVQSLHMTQESHMQSTCM